jgi:hypothetical protein
VLYRLRGPDYRGIEHLFVLNLAGDLICFLDKTVNGRTIGTPGLLAQLLEDGIEPSHLSFGLLR